MRRAPPAPPKPLKIEEDEMIGGPDDPDMGNAYQHHDGGVYDGAGHSFAEEEPPPEPKVVREVGLCIS